MWVVAAAAIGTPVAYLVWQLDPAYTLTAGLMLAPFAGNWQQGFGIPGVLSPDRLLLLAGVGAVLLRAPAVSDRPRLRIEAVHWVLGAAALYVLISAWVSGTLVSNKGFFRWFDTFGVLPFLLFLVAPLAFRTRRQRLVLLAGIVAMGAYLGLTALFETMHLRPLVFPKYILDPYFGQGSGGRAGGPFAEANTNGIGLYVCAIAAGIALISWQKRKARWAAASVGGLCLLGTLLTLQRSIWLGTVVATVVAILVLAQGRRIFVRIALATVICIAIAFAAVPSLGAHISERYGDEGTIHDRQNINRAALNMVEARPMFGFGWVEYEKKSADYFQQSPNYPLSGGRIDLTHNIFLSYAAELGLLGLGLWVLGLGLVIVGALGVRGPPDLDLWRTGLIPITIFLIVVLNAFPPSAAFPTRVFCLWAGVVWSGRYFERTDWHTSLERG